MREQTKQKGCLLFLQSLDKSMKAVRPIHHRLYSIHGTLWPGLQAVIAEDFCGKKSQLSLLT